MAVTATQAAARPTVEQAMALEPLQSDVEYDRPSSQQMENCTIKSEVGGGVSGWIVLDDLGRTLRRFLDTNGDNKVDRWCYFQRGLEVYRDVDSDYNGKADQYRWLGTAGTRWGIDRNEDGRIDHWKAISPEEVSAEVVAAVRSGDQGRFERLLVTSDELSSLGMGNHHQVDLEKRIREARDGFAGFAARQQVVSGKSVWLQFGGTRPGVLPAGTDGSTEDLVIYDNVAAIIETEGKHTQLIVGALLKVGDSWRVVDLPRTEATEGLFFASVVRASENETPRGPTGIDQGMQQLITDLESVDKAFAAAGPSQRPRLHAQRSELLQKLAERAESQEERDTWIRQFADMTSAAVQSGEYTGGLAELKQMLETLKGRGESGELLPYVRFRYLSANYGAQLQKPDADFAKIQEEWLANLKTFIQTYPKSEETAEAMLQLAIAEEFAGQEKEALRWYGRIVSDYPDASLAAKAAGAKRRLEAVGRSISLRGKSLDGKAVDLDRYRGNVVLIHYWATWCEPCKDDLQTLKKLYASYGRRGFGLIGINLDSDSRTAQEFARSQQLSWPQLYEPGGLDGRLANELGILTLPTMLLVDKSGRVVRRNVHAGELDEEIARLLK
jgi:thiol-disulfide isomerase/thioredoxin